MKLKGGKMSRNAGYHIDLTPINNSELIDKKFIKEHLGNVIPIEIARIKRGLEERSDKVKDIKLQEEFLFKKEKDR